MIFEKDFFKFVNNLDFEETVKNLQKDRDI